jgi:hypothetical protein
MAAKNFSFRLVSFSADRAAGIRFQKLAPPHPHVGKRECEAAGPIDRSPAASRSFGPTLRKAL